jgi:hypothetical protein
LRKGSEKEAGKKTKKRKKIPLDKSTEEKKEYRK